MRYLILLLAFCSIQQPLLAADSNISHFAGRYKPVGDTPRGIRVKAAVNKEWGGFMLYYDYGNKFHYSFRNRKFEYTSSNPKGPTYRISGTASIGRNVISFTAVDSISSIKGKLYRRKYGLQLIFDGGPSYHFRRL